MITAAIWLAWGAFYCLDLSTLPTPKDFRRPLSYLATALGMVAALLASWAVNQ